MDIAVPSRFACLKIEDDDFRPSNTDSKKKVNKLPNKKPNSAAKEASKGSWTTTRKKGNLNEAGLVTIFDNLNLTISTFLEA